MSKKVAVLLLVVLCVTFAVPYIAAAADKKQKSDEKPIWTIIGDSFKDFKVREQDKLRPTKLNVFQDMSDSLHKGSTAAREQSLRDKK